MAGLAARVVRALPRAVSFYRGSIGLTLRRSLRILVREGPSGVMRRIHLLTGSHIGASHAVDLHPVPARRDPGFVPLVSVIVPNYNHARHLAARLDSIDAQTYRNFEVILLDDRSDDDSVRILGEYAARHADNTCCCFNSANSGSVFRQWRKGLALARGALIWIAESDDVCSDNFLDELVGFFANDAVMLAIARTEFIAGDPPQTVWTQEAYLADLDPGGWRAPFIRSATDLLRLGWSARNIAPNASGVVFRNPVGLKLLDDPQWLGMRLCGDWLFYLNLIRGGLVGYSPAATNFYRQHGDNTSVKTQASDDYYREHECIGRRLIELYPAHALRLDLQEEFLRAHWAMRHGKDENGRFDALYSRSRMASETGRARKPNVAIAVYALCAGGGETFPLFLANQLRQRGHAVTVINFRGQATEEGVRKMLAPDIPLLDLPAIERVGMLLQDLGIEVVHSHHAWVDVNLATFLAASTAIRHVVTLHGMYEMMDRNQLRELLPRLEQRVDAFVHTTAKNLSAFPADFLDRKRFVRINNALAVSPLAGLSRADLGLCADDFVLCMVARAIPEKGWEEAIAAVVAANAVSARSIHLLLIGAGGEAERLARGCDHPFVHFLGFRPNVRDYFAVADAGLLPTRFKGESAPLVLIDCLLAGRPMLASAVGEIPHMLDSGAGLAGLVFALHDWTIDVAGLGRMIAALADDEPHYRALLARVPAAAARFDVGTMVDQYEALYLEVIESAARSGEAHAEAGTR